MVSVKLHMDQAVTVYRDLYQMLNLQILGAKARLSQSGVAGVLTPAGVVR